MAHVMQPGSAHFSGTYIPTMAGWVQANAFYAAVPFNSKPPPVPAGINPQSWQNGHWQPNPMFRPQPGVPHAQPIWAPHPNWGPAIAQAHPHPHPQANFNPHKRIPNPGDAAYWATKLSDNPLGLENMHIKDPVPTTERHVKEQNGVPHTPWVWVPKELTTDQPDNSIYRPNPPSSQPSHPQSHQPDKALPPPPPSSSLRDHTRAPSAPQIPYPTSYPPSSQSRSTHQALTPAPPSASAPFSSYSTYHQQQQQQQQQQQHPQQHPQQQQQQQHQQLQQRSQETQRSSDRYSSTSSQHSDPAQHARQHTHDGSRPPAESQSYRDYLASSTVPSSSASAAAAARERQRTSSGGQDHSTLDRANDPFSRPREMHLTFSPNIIRTPDHYSIPSNSRHNAHDDDHTPSRTPAAHGHIYAPAHNSPSRSTPSRSNSISVPRQSATPSASGQTTPSSSLGFLTFTEEPQALLSPLVVGSTPPTETKSSPGRDVSRSQSYPLVANSNYNVAFTGESEREGKVYPRTPRPYDTTRSRLEQDYDRSPDRDRSVNVTPQPPTRTPPMHSPPTRTPPSRTSPSYNARPSPETGSHHARQISRSYTYPSLTPPGAAIPPPVIPPPVIPSPVGSPPSNSAFPSPRHGSSSQHYSSNVSRQPSREYPSSSHAQPQQYSSSSSYSGPSYSRSSPNANSTRSRAASPLRHNPLPRPPAVSPYAESLTRGGGSSASAAAAAAAHQQSSYHGQSKRMARKGYWNRRGDYLYVTDKGERFIVYAPRPLANPEELKQYPSPTDGWSDHRGDFIKYDPKVPELLDSLPVHGEAPKRPYDHFVQYVEV